MENSVPSILENPSETAEKISGLNKLSVKAVQSEDESRKLFEPGNKPKNKGGRPRKTPDKTTTSNSSEQSQGNGPKVTIIQGFDARDGARGLFKVLSSALQRTTKCDDMALLPEEIDQLGELWGQVANQYMPAVMGAHGPLIFACITTAGVAFRLSTVAEAEIVRKRNAAARAQSAETVHTENRKPQDPIPPVGDPRMVKKTEPVDPWGSVPEAPSS